MRFHIYNKTQMTSCNKSDFYIKKNAELRKAFGGGHQVLFCVKKVRICWKQYCTKLVRQET